MDGQKNIKLCKSACYCSILSRIE